MKDKLKTLLLLVLFCMSIFLSRHLWLSDFGEVPSEENDMEEIDFENNLIRPYKVLLNFSKKNHTVTYTGSNLWEKSKDYIVEGLSHKNIKIERVKSDEYTDLLNKKSIVFHFPQRMNTYFLVKSLDIDNSNNIAEDIPKLEYVYLNLYGKERFLVIGYDDKLYKISNFSADTKDILAELKLIEKDKKYTNYYSAKESMDIESPLYIAYKVVEKYPYLYINDNDDINYIKLVRNNSEKFFNKDIDYIREIIEDNGAILHIYDQEVLKYGKDGSLEYFNPLQESIKERNLSMSLQKASEFLKDHIIDTEELYLSNIKEIEFKDNLGYRFIFRYNIEGIDLLEVEGKNDHVYIDVYNNYVQSYRKHIKTSMYKEYPDKEAVAPFTILNENYDLFREDYINHNSVEGLDEDRITSKVFESFTDISLYYVNKTEDDSSILKPIWLFKNKDIEYMFDFYDGELIYKRKIE